MAKVRQCGVAVEDLKFKDDRDVSSKLARVSTQFVYATLLLMLERRCLRNGVEYEWSQWSEISKQITKLFKKRKEVNTPGLWLVRRKELLGMLND